jgi:predicted nucleic acid-binding protein
MIMVDTDVLIWNLRGDERAAELLDAQPGLLVSAVSYMELVQGVRDKSELQGLRQALRFWHAELLQINESISARAMFLVEEHALAHGLQMADALIAASALETGATLVTANDRHYRAVSGLEIEVFRGGAR